MKKPTKTALRADVVSETLTDPQKLAIAVLLFHRGGPWDDKDRILWFGLTGSQDATTKTLCDLARKVARQTEFQNTFHITQPISA